MTQPVPPLNAVPLFPKIEAHLIEVLRSLSEADWQRPTICPGWTVKDVAAHLLDTNIRNLSMRRDSYFGEKVDGAESYESLVKFLDRLNADWIKAARRISPRVLITWMEQTSREVCEYFAGLDPYAKAAFPVGWAGELESRNWFDIAREYTERWHHQQQIRLAVARPGSPALTAIMTRELYHPVLDTFMRALPRTYADVAAPEGTAIKIAVTGEAGGAWFLVRRSSAWRLSSSASGAFAAEVSMPQDIAWRLFAHSLDSESRARLQIHGDRTLGGLVANAVAVMALRPSRD